MPLHSLARYAALTALVVVSACTSSGVGGSSASSAGSGPALSEDLFPIEARSAVYAMTKGERRTLRFEPLTADTSTLWFEGGVSPQRLDVERTATGIVLRSDLASGTEVIRFGAAPGAAWTSGESDVTFEGWERLHLPAGNFDAARVRTRLAVNGVVQEETWWFAPRTGILRLRSNYAGLFTEEMTLAPR